MADDSLQPAILVIFGITGDLAQRYLLPALYHLIKNGLLNNQTRLVGVTRGDTTTAELFKKIEQSIEELEGECDGAALKTIQAQAEMFKMDLDDPAFYDALLKRLNQIEKDEGVCMNRLYYLSIPPSSYGSVVRLLGKRGLSTSCQHNRAATRLLVEKPFGYDVASAKQLVDITAKA